MKYMNKSTQITKGLRKSLQSTDWKMANCICYGYATSADGELTINIAEAKIVRWIFEHYLGGDSFGKISASLEKKGVLCPIGIAKWNRESFSKLISNEKYTGSVLLQKIMSCAGMQFQNDGELDQVLIKGHDAAIIASMDFDCVQKMQRERSKHQTKDRSMSMYINKDYFQSEDINKAVYIVLPRRIPL